MPLVEVARRVFPARFNNSEDCPDTVRLLANPVSASPIKGNKSDDVNPKGLPSLSTWADISLSMLSNAIKANITIDQGADFSATIDVKAADGSVFSLASHTALGQMRKNYSSSTSAASFVCTDNGVLGQITIKLPNASVLTEGVVTQVGTADLEPGRYLYDIEITDSGDPAIVTRVVQGTATVTAGMTRA